MRLSNLFLLCPEIPMDPKKPYYCQVCDRTFPKEDWLQNHLKGKPHAKVLASKKVADPPQEEEEHYPEAQEMDPITEEKMKEWGYNEYMPGAKKRKEEGVIKLPPKEPNESYQPRDFLIDESTQDVPPYFAHAYTQTPDASGKDWLSPIVGLAPWEPPKGKENYPPGKEAQTKTLLIKRQNAAIGEELKRKLEEAAGENAKKAKQEGTAPTPVTLPITINEEGVGGVKCILTQDGTVQGKLVIPCAIDFKNM